MRGDGRLLALVALLALSTSACRSGHDAAVADETAADPTVAASPTPSPDTPLVTVVGERIPAAHWVSSGGVLTHRVPEVGSGDTVLPLVHAVGDWLDAHLDDLQRGGDGRLVEVADPGLLAAATPADLSAVTTDLASADRPVAAATYRLEGSYAAETEWLTATVEVTGRDGASRAATLVFVPTPEGPRLVLLGAAGGPA